MDLPWNREILKQKVAFAAEIQRLEKELAVVLANKKELPTTADRLADLETKMAKLWGLLLETNQYGKEKLTKHGRKFGGGLQAS